jgi:hypothetical protein
MHEICTQKKDMLDSWANYLPESFRKCSNTIWEAGNVLYQHTFFDKITKPESLDHLRGKWNRLIQSLNVTGTTSEAIGHLIHHQMTQETLNELIVKGRKSGKTNEIRLMVANAEADGLLKKIISEKEIYEQNRIIKHYNVDKDNLDSILKDYDVRSDNYEINIFKNSSNSFFVDKKNTIEKIFGELEDGINMKIYNLEKEHFIRIREMHNTSLPRKPYFDIDLLDLENIRIHDHYANSLIREYSVNIPLAQKSDVDKIVSTIVNKII